MSGDSIEHSEPVTEEIPLPVVNEVGVSAGKVVHGKLIPPQQQILLFTADDWERFIEEWVHFQRSQYELVTRLSSSADMGIDVAGFADDLGFKGVWDNYQCKHYGQPLAPNTAVKEIGKCIWYCWQSSFLPPRKYYFMAPRDCGKSLKQLLLDAPELKSKVIDKWEDWCANTITTTKQIPLEGEFHSFVEAFDFSIFTFKPALDAIDEHRHTPYFAARFGGGLPDRPGAETPPEDPTPQESRYLKQIFEAYSDHKGDKYSSLADLEASPDLQEHYQRQRENLYHAESLRNFARDNVPQGTFESLQDEVHSGVKEVESSSHKDGLVRMNAVTQAAAQLPLTANGLISVTKIQDKRGICHQLANVDRLQWVKS